MKVDNDPKFCKYLKIIIHEEGKKLTKYGKKKFIFNICTYQECEMLLDSLNVCINCPNRKAE